MPPAFGAEERERITGLLRETGHRLFTTQGLRKTSLDELVRPAGIAKSSFYVFFGSKEELYIDLMYQQLPAIREQMFSQLYDESVDLAERFKGLLRSVLDIQVNNPLYRRLLTHPDELELINRKLSPEQLERSKSEVIAPLVDFIEYMRDSGRLVDVEPRVVLGVVQAVLTVPLQEQMLDPDTYEPALELLIDLVTSGLIRS